MKKKRTKRTKPTKPPIPTEYQEQCAVFNLARVHAKKYPELRFLIGSLSGIRLTIGVAVKAKNSGCLVKGIPDLFLPVEHGGDYGLWIELKRIEGSKILPEQVEWASFLVRQGYRHRFAYGCDQAWDYIIKYLEG